ncbi:MAG TPA: NAD-dependent epimerase/dehydratase family protein, partial [Bacillota bacterium]
MSTLRCLVTGGMGFIGSYTCQALREAGCEVVAYDILTEGNTFDRSQHPSEREGLVIEAGDVLDRERLEAAMRRHGIDTVVHLAAILTAESFVDPVLA